MEISTLSRAIAAPPSGAASKYPAMRPVNLPAGVESGESAVRQWCVSVSDASAVLGEGCPQAVPVHRLDVALHLLAAAAGDGGAALLMHVHHEPPGFVLGVTEVRLEDIRHVAHEVDRVVVDDGHPRDVGGRHVKGRLARLGLFDLHGCDA